MEVNNEHVVVEMAAVDVGVMPALVRAVILTCSKRNEKSLGATGRGLICISIRS